MKSSQWLLAGLSTVIIIIALLWAAPQYNVYRMRLEGQAKLAESQASRQVKVSEAIANKEAASLNGEAELTKAEYQAKAAQAISSGLSPEYLQWLWVNGQMDRGDSTFVYIPTNSLGIPNMNLPITEANRLNTKPNTQP